MSGSPATTGLPTCDQERGLISLGREGEAEWWRLRRQLDLAELFWLGFLFTADPLVAAVLRRRTADVLRSSALTLLELRPTTPEMLQASLVELLQAPTHGIGCVWLEALRTDRTGETAGQWSTAWAALLLRLNERRDRLRRRLPCGLLLVMPTGFKDLARRAAPDFWSVRGMVLEPRSPVALSRAAPAATVISEQVGAVAVSDVALEWGETAEPESDSESQTLLRRAEGLLLRGEPRPAWSQRQSAGIG